MSVSISQRSFLTVSVSVNSWNGIGSHFRGLKDSITEGGVWRIRRRERSPAIELFRQEESGYGDILLPAFVEWRKCEPTSVEKDKPPVNEDE